MIDRRTILKQSTGGGVTGYTLEAHTWTDGNAMADYDAGTLLGTYTDNGDGTYYYDVSITVKGVIILKNSSGTQLQKIPTGTNKYMVLEGDNRPDIEP